MGKCILQRLHSSSFGTLLGNWDSQHLLNCQAEKQLLRGYSFGLCLTFCRKIYVKIHLQFEHVSTYINMYIYIYKSYRKTTITRGASLFGFLTSFLTFLRSKLHLWRKRRLVLHQHSENMCGIQLQMSSLLIAGWKIMELGIQKWWIHQITPSFHDPPASSANKEIFLV